MILAAVIAASLPSRTGLKEILKADGQIQVVAEAASIADLENNSEPFDVIVLMAYPNEPIPWKSEVIQDYQFPAVLLLSDSAQQSENMMSLPLRAWGILPTDFTETELISAIYAVDAGLITISPDHQNLLKNPITAQNSLQAEIPVSLTAREHEVLTLLSDGLANKQISLELEISEHTVKFHVSSIYQKLNVSNRAEAVRLGIQLGLIMV